MLISLNKISGRFVAHILDIAARLECNETVMVLGLKNPNEYLLELKKLGLNVKIEEVIKTTPTTFICDELGPIDIVYGEKIKEGYIFSLNNEI